MSRIKPKYLEQLDPDRHYKMIADSVRCDDRTIESAMQTNHHQSILMQLNALYCMARILNVANINELIEYE